MSNIREVKQKLTEIHRLANQISNMIPNIKEENEDITYSIGDSFKYKGNLCTLIQIDEDIVAMICLNEGNRYYTTSRVPNVKNVFKITFEEFDTICSGKGSLWNKVDNPLLGDK